MKKKVTVIKKAQSGGKAKPTYKNLQLANAKRPASEGGPGPATAKDSASYRAGFAKGLKGQKPSAQRKKYEGENVHERMGRWEGQNVPKRKGGGLLGGLGGMLGGGKNGAKVKMKYKHGGKMGKCKGGC